MVDNKMKSNPQMLHRNCPQSHIKLISIAASLNCCMLVGICERTERRREKRERRERERERERERLVRCG